MHCGRFSILIATAAFFAGMCSACCLSGAPPSAERAPPGGWKLADLAETMQTLGGRSYERGKRLFEQAHCTTCHRQENVGNDFGPDLARLDPRFQPLDILRDILDPSRRIADARYDQWIFETSDGRIIVGLIQAEDAAAVKVLQKPPALAPPTVLAQAEIEERRPTLASMMPLGLLDNLTRDEIADLVAYIAARGDPADPIVQPDKPPASDSRGSSGH